MRNSIRDSILTISKRCSAFSRRLLKIGGGKLNDWAIAGCLVEGSEGQQMIVRKLLKDLLDDEGPPSPHCIA
jgi:hypothetical protein